MLTYTVFCVDDQGTYVSAHDTSSIEAAKREAVSEAAKARGCDPDDLSVLGVAAGNVTTLEWGDEA